MEHGQLHPAGVGGEVGGQPPVLGGGGGPVLVEVDLVGLATLGGRGPGGAAGRPGGRAQVRRLVPGGIEHVDAHVAALHGVPGVGVADRRRAVGGRGRIVVDGVGAAAGRRSGGLGPVAQADHGLAVVTVGLEGRQSPGLRPVGGAEEVADVGAGLAEVTVVLLVARRIGGVAGVDHEPGAGGPDQRVDGRLVGVEVVGRVDTGRHLGLPEVVDHGEGQGLAGGRAHRVQGGEGRRGVGPEQVDRLGPGREDPVAVGRAGGQSGQGHGGLVLVHRAHGEGPAGGGGR